MGEVLTALRLEDVPVVAQGFLEQVLEGVHLGDMPDGNAGVGIGKPEAVVDAETRVAVHRQAESARKEFAGDDVADSLVLHLHGLVGWTAEPWQVRTDALAPDQPGTCSLDSTGALRIRSTPLGLARVPARCRQDSPGA